MKNKGAKPKSKKKGAFGCDLSEYLETSGQDVPLVLKSCAEFIERFGVVDGIYRLSGVTSNIQKLRQEFGSDQCPDLTKEVYLQDIHCVGSLCKLYFRELPNPLLTYQLYTKFTEAVSCCVEEEQLSRIQNVIQELPPSHYRTLEYLSRHLTHIASFSTTTNMHIRNLALVWAPNLLRSKEIEDAGCNGDAAFLEVRVQQVVIEFILNHMEQIFSKGPPSPTKHRDEDLLPLSIAPPTECRIVKSMTLPSGSLPMKLVSLEEAQARSLSATHPARKERRENSLPEIVPVTGTSFHTVIDLPENKRKLSTKSKKWKSIFNLGRSGTESKSKLSRNGSVFVRGPKEMGEKATIRPAKSMDSLCSLPVDGEDEKASRFKRPVGTGGFFIPVLKSRATGTGSTYDVSKQDNEWEAEVVAGATGGSNQDKPTKTSQAKQPPEQMKVFRIGDDLENEQNSPKGRKMFYGANDGSSKSGFPGSLFPLEASPRHQRKALNISEPFAVSVPLRVSAVISSNSMPCRLNSKERPLLSSLEELPLLEPDTGSKSPDSSGKSGLKTGARSPDVTEPVKILEPRAACLEDLSQEYFEEDNRTLTLKEILLEMSQLPDILPISAVDRKPEYTFVSINKLHEAIELEPNKPSEAEAMKTPPEVSPANDVENLFPNDQEEDAAVTLLDPLWSDIQQELKIIESEEELSTAPETSTDSKKGSSSPSPSQKSLKEDNIVDVVPGFSVEQEIPQLPDASVSSTSEQDQEEIVTELENVITLPQETHECIAQEEEVLDGQGSKTISEAPTEETPETVPKAVPVKKERTTKGEPVSESEDNLQVISDLDGEKEEDTDDRSEERKSSESLDNDEDVGGDGAQTFELEELWEEHQWVTSPLHSPKLKNIGEGGLPVIPPRRRGTTGELYKRPEFTRSLSLDSKDTRTSQWTLKIAEIKADGSSYIKSRTGQLFNRNLQNEPQQSQMTSTLPEVAGVDSEVDSLLKTEHTDQRPCMKPVIDLSWTKVNEFLNTTPASPRMPLNSLDTLPNVDTKEMKPLPSVCNKHEPSKNTTVDKEGSSEKPKSRPPSLTLESTSSSAVIFTFEDAPVENPAKAKPGQIHQSAVTTTISLYDRSKSLNDRTVSHQSNELDYTAINHTPMGRRNSAPVSVSAVRASFMIKMCQAKAVPVVPPKVQYTQIPQPLQVFNSDSEIPHEKKEVVSEPDLTPAQTLPHAAGQTDIPKTPKAEVKAVEEKENSDPVSADVAHHSSLNPSSDSSRGASQDAPVLRRKRTSDGEASGDTPLLSKMERPLGLSKSFRSRPGRPQSLILFSPPFPIMDHPSVDSRILLSPIRSPTQTSPQESTCDNLRTPDGVILRNKMTIPKNGQRLETSTSCFYQPQRRSVILDSRSGRQIE